MSHPPQTGSPVTHDDPAAAYFRTRFVPDARREALWRHLNAWLRQFIPADAAVLELGAGYCYFINGVSGRRRAAIDLGPQVTACAAPGVEAHQGDAIAVLRTLPSASFDFVFASNFFEHFEWPQLFAMIAEIRRVLTPRGRLALIQPNFRLAPRRYFDDYTHRTIHTDVSLHDWLESEGFRVIKAVPRFMPLTVKSAGGGLTWLVPLYLRLPWRPFAGQMFILAECPDRARETRTPADTPGPRRQGG
jgi:SAM-dependent methyltransferase